VPLRLFVDNKSTAVTCHLLLSWNNTNDAWRVIARPWLTGTSMKDSRSNCLWSRIASGLASVAHTIFYDVATTGVCLHCQSYQGTWVVHVSAASCKLWCNADAILMPPLGCCASQSLSAISLSVSCRETTEQSKLHGRAWWVTMTSQKIEKNRFWANDNRFSRKKRF